MGGTSTGTFPPFTDRLSRDLGNGLSEALLAAPAEGVTKMLVARADSPAPPPQFGILPPTVYRSRHSAQISQKPKDID